MKKLFFPQKILIFRCKLCSTALTNNKSCLRHYKSHIGDETHKCFLCEKGFHRRDALQSHMKSHAGVKLEKLVRLAKKS